MSATAQGWVDAERQGCLAPRCRFGQATATDAAEARACRAAQDGALDELAKTIKVRVQSVFEDTVEAMDGTAFSEVRSQIVVSTDVELEGAEVRCHYDEGTAYAFARLDFGPMIDELTARLDRATRQIAADLESGAAARFDESFVGYARALVDAIDADDARTWLVGLDPGAAAPYAHVPRLAVLAVDGLHARAKQLRLVPADGHLAWVEAESRVEVRLQSDAGLEAPLRRLEVDWSGPLVERLGGAAPVITLPNGRVGLPLPRPQPAPGGVLRAAAALDWRRTLAVVRGRVVAPRADRILDWLVDGLPTVRTEVAVYTPGHPSPLVDSLRQLFCDGDPSPLSRALRLQNRRGAPLPAAFRRDFEDRLIDAMAAVRCRRVILDAPTAPQLEVQVSPPPTDQDAARLRLIDRDRGRRVSGATEDIADVCPLRCSFKQWEAAEHTCRRLPPRPGPAALCLLRARYYRGDHQAGLALAERLYRTDRADPAHRGWYGILQVATGANEPGRRILERLTDAPFADRTPSFWLSLAAARAHTDDQKGACAALRRFTKLPEVPQRAAAVATMARLECSEP